MDDNKTYKVGSDVYDIPQKDITAFLKDNPNAIETEGYTVGKDTFDIPVTEKDAFLKDNPAAQLIKKKLSSQDALTSASGKEELPFLGQSGKNLVNPQSQSTSVEPVQKTETFTSPEQAPKIEQPSYTDFIAKSSPVRNPLIEATDATNIHPQVKHLTEPHEYTVRDYLNEKGVAPQNVGLPKDTNLDRKLRDGEQEGFDSLLKTKGLGQIVKPSYFWGASKEVNNAVSSVLRDFDDASKTLSNITGLKYGGGFKALADQTDYSVQNLPNMPKTEGGRLLSGGIGLEPLFIEMALTPQTKFTLLGKAFKTSRFLLQSFMKGFVNKYAKTIDENEVSSDKKSPLLKGVEGMGGGAIQAGAFMALGYTGGALGKMVATSTKSGVLGGVTNSVVNAGGFAGADMVSQVISGNPIDWDQVRSSAELGIAMTIPQFAEFAGMRAVGNYLTSSPRVESDAKEMKITPEEARDKAADIRDQANNETDIQKKATLEATANTLDNITDVKVIADQARENPMPLINSIEESDLSKEQKELFKEKVFNTAKENPDNQKTADIDNKISLIDKALEEINKNEAWSDTKKEVESAPLKERKEELKQEAKKVYGIEPKEEPKGEDGKVKEKPKAVQTESSQKFLDELDKPKIEEQKPEIELTEDGKSKIKDFLSDNNGGYVIHSGEGIDKKTGKFTAEVHLGKGLWAEDGTIVRMNADELKELRRLNAQEDAGIITKKERWAKEKELNLRVLNRGIEELQTKKEEVTNAESSGETNQPKPDEGAPELEQGQGEVSDVRNNAEKRVTEEVNPLISPSTEETDPIKLADEVKNETWYHGTGEKTDLTKDIIDPKAYGDVGSLVGLGLYTTADPSVAKKYARSNGRVFKFKFNPAKVINGDAPLTSDIIDAYKKYFTDNDPQVEWGTSIDEFLAKNPKASLVDLHKHILDEAMNSEITKDSVTDLFQEVSDELSHLGYDGITHEGGRALNQKIRHRVLILLDPESVYNTEKPNIISSKGEYKEPTKDIPLSDNTVKTDANQPSQPNVVLGERTPITPSEKRVLNIKEDGFTIPIMKGEDNIGSATIENGADGWRIKWIDSEKGTGRDAMRLLNAEARKEGKVLISDIKGKNSVPMVKAWDKLVESGEAEKLGDEDYKFKTTIEPQKNVSEPLSPENGNIPPQEPPIVENAPEQPKVGSEREKSLLNRMHKAENLSDAFKKGVEGKGLTYESIPNSATSEEVDYLIAEKGFDESEKSVLNQENNIEPRIRALAATRLIKHLDDLAETADNPKDEVQYRNRSIALADFIDKSARRWGQGIQMLGSAEVNAMLSPKSQIIRIKRVVRSQRDTQIENNKTDIDKKTTDIRDVNEKSIDEVVKSKEYEELKKRIAELEKKLQEKPRPPKEKPTSESQAKIKKEQDYRKSQWEVFKKGTETTSASAIGLSKEQIEALGNIIGSYVREGVIRTEDILNKLKKDYFKNTGKILSDEDAKSVLPEKIDGKLLSDIQSEGEIKESAEKLTSRINRMLEDPKVPKDDPVKQMIDTLFEKVKEKDTKEKIPQEKKSAIDKIRDSITDKQRYADVWEQAKEEILLKIETNEELSEEQKSEYNKRIADFYNEVIGKPFSEKQVEGAVKQGLKDLDVSIDKVVRDHYTVYDATKRTLQYKLIDELGLDGESAKMLSEAIGKEFDKIAIARKKAILKQGVTAKEAVHPKTAKQLHDKLIELSNMGAFSDAEFAEAYADKWGFPKLEEEQIKEIEKRAKAVQDAPEGYQKFEKIQDLLAYVENVKGVDMGDVYMSMWYSSILSGYRTQSKNFIQNSITSLFEGAVSTIRHPMYTGGLIKHLISGWGEGVRQFGHIMKTGYNPIKGYKVEVPNVQERFQFKGGDKNPANWGKYVTRIMVAADAFSYSGLKEMRSYEVAMNMARKIKAEATEPTKKTWAIANELLNKTSERVAIAEKTAESEGLSGVEYKRRVWELMEQGRSKDIVEDAAHFAARGTFNYAPEGTLGMITESISHLTQNAAIKMKIPFSEKEFTVRPGKFIVPFTRIIANVTNMALDYYPPIGFSRAAMGGIGAKGFEVSPLTAKFYRKYTPEERQKVLIKAMVGVAAQVGFYLLTEPDDKGESSVEITANGYGDYQKNYELKELGWQPYSIKIGGKWVSYQYTPLILAMAPIGYYRDMQKYNKDKFDEDKIIQNLTLAHFKGLQVINDMTWASSLNSLMSAFSAKEPGQAQSYLKNLATSTAKGIVYPKLAEQITQVIDAAQKNPRHDASDLVGKIMRDIPIVRNHYNVMLNAVGEPVKYDPVQMIGNAKSDPFWEFIIGHNVTIGKPDAKRSFYDDVTKTERGMTNQEYYDFVHKTGQEIKDRIENDVIKANLPEDEIAKEISNIKTEVRKKFETELFGWSELRKNHPDDWQVMRDNDALQVPRTSEEIRIAGKKTRIGTKKGIPSSELEDLNNIAMEKYHELVMKYLKNQSVVEEDKKSINPESGESKFDTKIKTMWSVSITKAKVDESSKISPTKK